MDKNEKENPAYGLGAGQAESWGMGLMVAGLVSLVIVLVGWASGEAGMVAIGGIPMSIFAVYAGSRIWRW